MANKIHKVDDTFVISDDGGWLPGCYDSFETAEKAHTVKHLENWRFCDDKETKVFGSRFPVQDWMIERGCSNREVKV